MDTPNTPKYFSSSYETKCRRPVSTFTSTANTHKHRVPGLLFPQNSTTFPKPTLVFRGYLWRLVRIVVNKYKVIYTESQRIYNRRISHKTKFNDFQRPPRFSRTKTIYQHFSGKNNQQISRTFKDFSRGVQTPTSSQWHTRKNCTRQDATVECFAPPPRWCDLELWPFDPKT